MELRTTGIHDDVQALYTFLLGLHSRHVPRSWFRGEGSIFEGVQGV